MVDFKKALEAKKMFIKCDGHVGYTNGVPNGPCNNEATCYFEFTEDNEDGPVGHYTHCEDCFRRLFPRASDEGIEEAKRDMLVYKYRKLGETP